MNSLRNLLFIFTLASARIFAADPFAENVRTTDPLTPEEEQKTFKLPPGFKIQLVASEPDIQKPMNMAFDSKGRLWVSMSREYPFPVPLGKPARDSIRILEDFDENGRAHKVTTFVDGLNIPIGIYPYKNGVIAWSIPNIWFFEDTDGDGKADKRTPLYGPFGWERDTHGNQASFRRGFDGWMYATHGYNNISHVKAKDGSEINVQSGNTYRIALDGSHIDQHTHGQVNPFGLCFDPTGSIYSADCHSAPIYELLRGGWYPSFGKPDDGLGFAPVLMEHSHGSTAICGITYYADDLWPAEFQKNILIGNVMTSRLNRDTLLDRGSSKTAREEPDFLTTNDPWFRPVDNQLGPDGALYVLDFYNRIIGHYEVPLTHPGRDRERARIWRITYDGKKRDLPNLSKETPEQLVAEFRSPNLPRRLLSLNEFVDRGSAGAPLLKKTLSKEDPSSNEVIQCLWGLHRLDALDDATLEKFAKSKDANVRTHVMHILSERKSTNPEVRTKILSAGLNDSEPLVKRAAADAMGQFPNAINVTLLLGALKAVPQNDDHLRYTIRMALKNQLQSDAGSSMLSSGSYDEQEAREVASICLAIPNPQAASFLLQHIQKVKEQPAAVASYVRHAVRYLDEKDVPKMTAFIREKYGGDIDQQLSFFKALQDGSAQRGLALGEDAKTWAADLATKLLDSAGQEDQPWHNIPIGGKRSANPWFLQERASADGDKKSVFLCSLPPGGEQLTGILRSRTFSVPRRLSFWLAGHDGVPTNPPHGNNLIRLVSAENGNVLAQAPTPRNDMAQKVEWDFANLEGKQAFLEVVDADAGEAYAWLAVGRFDPPVVPMPPMNPSEASHRINAAADIAKTLRVNSLAPKIARLLANETIDAEAQGSLAIALVALEPNETRIALAPLVGDASIPADLRRRIARILAEGEKAEINPVLVDAMRAVPSRVQVKLAQSLAGSANGAETLLALAEKSQVSPRVLLDKTVQDKISALNSPALSERYRSATKDLEPTSEAVQKLIDQRRASYNSSKAEPVEGSKVFLQNCAICHQIDGNGAVIGPQLDGIGSRGLERIIEDILDPNRNVDINFRTQVLVLKDGDVVSGLLRREEGELLVLADSTGKEINVPKKDVQSRRQSDTSLMPANFGDIIPEPDFQNLMAYLLSKGAQPAPLQRK